MRKVTRVVNYTKVTITDPKTGEVLVAEKTHFGKVTMAKIAQADIKANGYRPIDIHIESIEEKRSMSAEDFLLHSEVVNEGSSIEEAEELTEEATETEAKKKKLFSK